jgi:hypothetical protein
LFDPDIVVVTPGVVLKNVVNCGVALCEDVNSPLQKYHRKGGLDGLKDFNLKFKK